MAMGIEAGVEPEQRQVNTRDPTPGKIWIERLERPDRIPGLRIYDVVDSLKLKPGDVVADEAAWQGLRRYLDWDRIDFETPITPLTVFESPVRICVRDDVSLSFGDAPDTSVCLTISSDIDRHNFERLEAGSASNESAAEPFLRERSAG